MPSFISGANITDLCSKLAENTAIDPKLYEKYHVKRGLRNSDGTGVVAGITNICNVHGYIMNEGELEPIPVSSYTEATISTTSSAVLKPRTATAMRRPLSFSCSVTFPQKRNSRHSVHICLSRETSPTASLRI